MELTKKFVVTSILSLISLLLGSAKASDNEDGASQLSVTECFKSNGELKGSLISTTSKKLWFDNFLIRAFFVVSYQRVSRKISSCSTTVIALTVIAASKDHWTTSRPAILKQDFVCVKRMSKDITVGSASRAPSTSILKTNWVVCLAFVSDILPSARVRQAFTLDRLFQTLTRQETGTSGQPSMQIANPLSSNSILKSRIPVMKTFTSTLLMIS